MFEKFLSQNAESFRQRYEGTFGFYKDEQNKRLLVRLDRIRDNRCTFVDAQGIEYQLNPNTERNIGFEFIPPKSAWYNTADGAIYAQRMAARQFSRGINGRNLEMYLLKKSFVPMRIDFPSLASVYDTSLSLKDAVGLFEKGNSLAISNQFALDPIRNRVFLFKEVIGNYTLSGKKLSIKLHEPELWRTEITDALNSIDYSSEITQNV